MENMNVVKRSGHSVEVSFDKILKRIKVLGNEVHLSMNYTELAIQIIDQLYDGIETRKIDEISAQLCASQISKHPNYGILSSRIIISNLHKNTIPVFSDAIAYFTTQPSKHILSEQFIHCINNHKDAYNEMIVHDRDFNIDYFGFKTLERAYLLRRDGKILERPQYMWMRVAIGIHSDDLALVKETYDLLSTKQFTHATPTLFNAGTKRPQLSSCYLLGMQDDSIEGIYDTLKDCALISKWAGGIGIHIHNIRARGTKINGTNGTSNGIVPMLKPFNETARYVDQGGGRRNGSFAIYLSPDHPDIEDWLDLKKNTGDENARARDLFYGLWVPDLFMERVHANQEWSLFCPSTCPNLNDVYGKEYETLYLHYESNDMANKKVNARELWFKILDAQMETGTPYLLFKDAANLKSNQQNIGTIRSSNLCAEIIEYSDKDETAVCNLASIALSQFVQLKHVKQPNSIKVYSKTKCNFCKMAKALLRNFSLEYTEELLDDDEVRKGFYDTASQKTGKDIHSVPQIFFDDQYIGGWSELKQVCGYEFNHERLHRVTKVVTRNLNKVIDINYYPTDKTKVSNIKHRPIGIGVQGLADVFMRFKIPFYSDQAKQLNEDIFETIYHAAMEESVDIAIQHDTYSTFDGSPLAQGLFQFDLWKETPKSGRYDWEDLRESVKQYGVRNSLLVALMPTASTSQILGNNECFEPITSNIYNRRTLAGEFMIVNQYLVQELIDLDIWNHDMKNMIIAHHGSVQHIDSIPQEIKDRYKIVWEMPMRQLIDMAADRGKYVCQSQSMNLWVEDPNYKVLTSMHFYAWKKGLKTGIYYLRRKPRHQVQQFTIEPTKDDICDMCSG
jgi:ribonucleoside-diphosphate reductase alpha subunit